MIDVFRILVHVNTNMISRVILENTWITRIVNAERERLIDKPIDECNEKIDGNEMVYNTILYNNEKLSKSCTLKIVLLIITIMDVSGACFYFYRHTIKKLF